MYKSYPANTLASAIQAGLQATARTENGALTNATTGSAVLDLFSIIAASRKNPQQAVNEFKKAFRADPRIASQILLWSRDIRGGAGERNVFRQILKAMQNDRDFAPYMARIINYIGEIGRWDDLLIFDNMEWKIQAYNVLRTAIWNGNGLAAKWMPRKGKLVPEIRQAFGMTPKQYRKLIVGLTKCVEQKMCAKEWMQINYSHVPSVAAARYQKAFTKHDPVGYAKYRAELVKPEGQRDPKVKINAAAVYPYDIIKSLSRGDVVVAEAQWTALPNYMKEPVNVIPMIDTSGSMDSSVGGTNRAIDIAVSLGLYVAEKNRGPLANIAFSFQGKPRALYLNGSLKQRYQQILNGRPAENTDLQAGFRLLLDLAKQHNVPADQMPKYILVISDMEFDSATTGERHWNGNGFVLNKTNHHAIVDQYKASGYDMPNIIYWNVMSRNTTNKPVTIKDDGTALVSGFSPSILQTVLSGNLEQYTPLNVMLETVDVPRYKIFE